MYEITVSVEFTRWFESLDEAAAECVVSALELLGATGPELDPVRQSRLMLWYDGLAGEAVLRLGVGVASEPPAWQVAVERTRELMAWQHQALAFLDSQAFRAALGRLEPGPAAELLGDVEAMRRVWSAAWAHLRSAKHGLGTVAGRRVYYHQVERTREAFFLAVSRAGFDAKRVIDVESGLRELTLSELSPRVRVIYAFDVEARRLLALIGEPLTRTYYGDSVRLAEKLWREHKAQGTSELAVLAR